MSAPHGIHTNFRKEFIHTKLNTYAANILEVDTRSAPLLESGNIFLEGSYQSSSESLVDIAT
jgi:hypothetical protein